MSRDERTGVRDLTFSGWHRTLPDRCTAIDVDLLEYCRRCREPLALIELGCGYRTRPKPTTALRRLAERAGVPAYLVLYEVEGDELADLARITRVWPDPSAEHEPTVTAVGRWIVRIHDEHACAMASAA